MEKQALLGPPAPRRIDQGRRPASQTALSIAVIATWAILSWCFLVPRLNPRPRNAEPPLREYAGESIRWRPCGDLECGSVHVPMDHLATPDVGSDDTTFAVPLVRMRGRADAPNLLVHPGGPGASGTRFMHDAAGALRTLVGDHFHIVGFDPRGTNSSTPPATCFADAASRHRARPRRATDLIRDSPYLYAWSTNYGRACQDNAAPHLSHVNTPQTAADINSILDALGQPTLLYWGVGYGALLGQVYATLFPRRVARMVLDGIVDQRAWFGDMLDGQRYADTEAVVDGFFAECVRAAGPDACALNRRLGKTTGGGAALRANLTSVINALYRTPASAYVNGTAFGVVDDFAARIGAVFWEMRAPARWPALARRLADLQAGDATGVFLAYGGSDDALPEAGLAVRMNDGPSGPAFWPQPRLRLMEMLLPYLDQHRFAAGDMLAWHLRQQWDVPRTHAYYVPPGAVRTAAPLLLMAATRDPVTPYAAARAALKTFAGARLVALDAYGHASLAMPSLCVAAHLRAYLARGSLPEENVVCEMDGAYFPSPGAEEQGSGYYGPEERAILAAQRALAESIHEVSLHGT